MCYRNGNTGFLGEFGEFLPHRFLDSRLRELDTNTVGLAMAFRWPTKVKFQVQRTEVFQGTVEHQFEGLGVLEQKPTFIR